MDMVNDERNRMPKQDSAERIARQTDRAADALDALKAASTDAARLDAAKALESAACQLRRALKQSQSTPEPPRRQLTTTKVTGLTGLNVAALREVFPEEIAQARIVLTATTALFAENPHEALELIAAGMRNLPGRGHPRQSLHAVARKLRRLEVQA